MFPVRKGGIGLCLWCKSSMLEEFLIVQITSLCWVSSMNRNLFLFKDTALGALCCEQYPINRLMDSFFNAVIEFYFRKLVLITINN